MPEVSICIPAFNNPGYLVRAIDSVLIQSFTDYEIIVTDDTLGNNIQELIKIKYSSLKNFRYFKNDKSLGPVANWNKAISYANSPLIKLLHHDDWFCDKDSLAEFVRPFLNDSKVDFVFCQSNHYDGLKLLETKRPGSKALDAFKLDHSYLFYRNFIIAPSSTMHRKTNLVYDANLSWLVDVDYYVAYLKNSNYYYISKPLINLNISKGRLTSYCENNPKLLIQECFYLLTQYNNDSNATLNILKYFRKLVRLHKLYNVEKIKRISECKEMHADVENLIKNITFIDRFFDLLFRITRRPALLVLGPNYKIYVRKILPYM